ncbi:MAG TPA: magnesium/cobalt transporter CorA [Bacillota bacterium]|nr:magnesium/cobalt transporter CorA [Bacillota bacterium]
MLSEQSNVGVSSLEYTGAHRKGVTVFEIYTYGTSGSEFLSAEGEKGLQLLRDKLCCGNLVWANIIGLDTPHIVSDACAEIGLPPLFIEDVVHVGQRSKLETSDDMLFATVTMVRYNRQSWQSQAVIAIEHEHLSLVLTKTAVVTFQEKPGDVFDGVRQRLEHESDRMRASGSDYLFYSLLDALVDQQLEIIQMVAVEVDNCEREFIEENKVALTRLYGIRKELLLMRSASFPLRDMMLSLLTPEVKLISSAVTHHLRDVHDHVAHVADLVVLNREMVNNLYEMHMLDTNNNLNRVMTTLTVFSAIFIPLNFLASFFGMNFRYFPGLNSPQAIPVVIGVCAAIAAGMVYFFRSRDWF